MEHLSALTFAARQALMADGISLSTGHAQQLAAAAFGHNNLASYQASGEDDALPEAQDIALDTKLLEARAEALGCNGDAFSEALVAALRQRFPSIGVHVGHEALAEAWQSSFESAIVNDEQVNSQVAMTNGTFPQTDDLQLPWWDGFGEYNGDALTTQFDGFVIVDQDEDRVNWGEEIDVRALLTVERLGRRLFGRCSVRVEWAKLRWFGEGGSTPE